MSGSRKALVWLEHCGLAAGWGCAGCLSVQGPDHAGPFLFLCALHNRGGLTMSLLPKSRKRACSVPGPWQAQQALGVI